MCGGRRWSSCSFFVRASKLSIRKPLLRVDSSSGTRKGHLGCIGAVSIPPSPLNLPSQTLHSTLLVPPHPSSLDPSISSFAQAELASTWCLPGPHCLSHLLVQQMVWIRGNTIAPIASFRIESDWYVRLVRPTTTSTGVCTRVMCASSASFGRFEDPFSS